MGRRVGRCWGCGKECEGEFCDMDCIVLWRDKQHLDVPIPTSNTAPRIPDNLTTSPTPTSNTDNSVSNHVRTFEAKDGLWYVELDAVFGKIYYKAGPWREAKRVIDLLKEHGTVVFQ